MLVYENPTPAGDSKNNTFAALFHAYRFLKSVLPSLCTLNGPSSCNAPYASDEQSGPVYFTNILTYLLHILLILVTHIGTKRKIK